MRTIGMTIRKMIEPETSELCLFSTQARACVVRIARRVVLWARGVVSLAHVSQASVRILVVVITTSSKRIFW